MRRNIATKIAGYCIVATLLLLPILGAAQSEHRPVGGNIFSAGNEAVLCDFESLWRYHTGDSAHWSDPAYVDSAWSIMNPGFSSDLASDFGWPGIGWFRYHLTLDSSQFGRATVLFLRQSGASEVYLNGQRVVRFGKIGRNAETTVPHLAVVPSRYYFVLPNQTENIVAIRFANFEPSINQHWDGLSGFQLAISYANEGTDFYIEKTRIGVRYQIFFTGFCLAVALLHLFLFLYYPRYIGNLYYTIFTLSCAGLAYFPAELSISNLPGQFFAYTYLFKLSLITAAVFGPLVLYTSFYIRLPHVFWFLAGGGAIMTAIAGYLRLEAVYLFLFFGLFESLRVTILSVYRRKDGARLIGAGYLAFIIGGSIEMLGAFDMFRDIVPGDSQIYLWGILGLLIATSIYLARTFARMNKTLIDQLDQVNQLSAKTIEQTHFAHEQDLKRKLLEKEIAHNRSELEKTAQLETALGELEAAHSQLQQADARLRVIIDTSPVPLIVSRISDGTILYANKHLGRLVGYTVENLEGKSSPDFYYDPEDRREVVERLRRDGVIDNYEVRIKHRKGNTIWCLFSLVASRIGDDDVIIGGLYDISERKEAEEKLRAAHTELKNTQTQLVQSEKMASLGTLVAGIAHEINTPVGAIRSMHDTLIRAIEKLKTTTAEHCTITDEDIERLQPLLDTIDEANKVIESGTDRVTTIVKRLRSFARLDEADLKKADINEGLEDTLMMIHHQIKGRITINRNYGEIGEIACHPGQLNQVFLNLLNNAQQAIDGNGVIDIITFIDGDSLFIKITDNGYGIPPENMKKIFDPGFTSKGVGVGTGLGLSICYKIIQEHQGEIAVNSEVGKGTTFTVRIPTDLDTKFGKT